MELFNKSTVYSNEHELILQSCLCLYAPLVLSPWMVYISDNVSNQISKFSATCLNNAKHCKNLHLLHIHFEPEVSLQSVCDANVFHMSLCGFL